MTIRSHGKKEVFNFVYELETWDGSDNELTTKSESEIGEDSDIGDYCILLLNLKEVGFQSLKLKNVEGRGATSFLLAAVVTSLDVVVSRS